MNAPDFEVLHSARVYPDGDPAAQIREQLQRVLREAVRQGFRAVVQPAPQGHAVSVVRVPGRGD